MRCCGAPQLLRGGTRDTPGGGAQRPWLNRGGAAHRVPPLRTALGDDDPLVRALAEAVTAMSDGTGPGVTLAETDADIDVLAADGAC